MYAMIDIDLDIYQIFIIFTVLILLHFWLTKPPQDFPPFPAPALPFIGHLYLMKKNPLKQFEHWSKKYRDIYGIRIGTKYIVVLNSYEVIKEAFVVKGDKFSNRSTTGVFSKLLRHRTKGVLFSSGPIWKEQRSISIAILKDMGMGKNVLAESIGKEVTVFIQEIARLNGQPVNLKYLTRYCLCNVISSILFGKRFEFDDPRLWTLLQIANDIALLLSGVSILNFLPELRYIPFDPFKGNSLIAKDIEFHHHVHLIIREIIDQAAVQNKCFITLYMDHLERRKTTNQPTAIDQESLVEIIVDLFGAGSETTSTTILWILIFALHHPDIQDKLHEEIVNEIGTERSPTIHDKPKLKLLNAFLLETGRMACTVPFVVNECSETVSLNGFTIPRECLVIANLVSVHGDPRVWTDPKEFRPDRFLDKDGNLITKQELITFSRGKRACLGESLANMELFLFTSALFQRFKFSPEIPGKMPNLTPVFGITLSPENYEIRCVDRLV